MSLFDHIKKPATPSFANMGKPAESTTPVVAEQTSADTNENSAGWGEAQTPTSAPETNTAVVDANADAHFFVGIDLGTTHCVLSYAVASDDEDAEFSQQVMAIPQLTALGMVEDKNQLPSFLYQAHEAEIGAGETALPWTNQPEY